MTKLVPVTLVISDTGPLISLAVVDRLDLLQAFGTTVFVTDAVMYECLRHADKPGADRLQKWFQDVGTNQHRIVKTPFGPAYLEAIRQEEQDGVEGATKNFGEWATSWVMDHLPSLLKQMRLNPGDHFGLILSEDNAYLYGNEPHAKRPANTHFLSTRAFFFALEKAGFIPSAENLRQEVRSSGRTNFSNGLPDLAFKGRGFQTDYKAGIKRSYEQRDADTSGPSEAEGVDKPNPKPFN